MLFTRHRSKNAHMFVYKLTVFVNKTFAGFVKMTVIRVLNLSLWLESSHSVRIVTRVEPSQHPFSTWCDSSQVNDSNHAITPLCDGDWEFSHTAKLPAFQALSAPILIYGQESWWTTQEVLSQYWQRWVFCKEATIWRFVTKCVAMKVLTPWISSHFSE